MPDVHVTIVRPVVTEKTSAAYGARTEILAAVGYELE